MEQLVLDVWVLYEAPGFGASTDGSSKMVVRGSFVLMYAKPVQSRAGELQQYARMQHASTSALVTGCLETANHGTVEETTATAKRVEGI